jgi:hypothetical protein
MATFRHIFFRFLLIFLGGSTIMCWDNIGDMIHRTFGTAQYNFDAFYGFLHAPVYGWISIFFIPDMIRKPSSLFPAITILVSYSIFCCW